MQKFEMFNYSFSGKVFISLCFVSEHSFNVINYFHLSLYNISLTSS